MNKRRRYKAKRKRAERNTWADMRSTRIQKMYAEANPTTILLSAGDWEFFNEQLKNPQPPNEALKKLLHTGD